MLYKKIACLILSAILLTSCISCGKKPLSNQHLYNNAVADAKVCDAEEISPLLELSEEGNLLITWHNFPHEFESGHPYIPRAEVELWCVSYNELQEWYHKNRESVSDWTKRLEQLLGLPEGFGYTHFTAFAVTPDKVIRPAYQTDPQKQITERDLDGSALGEHANWFEYNSRRSYEDGAWPWTRLGYTYDWAHGQERGLCEFLLRTGTEVTVEWTVTTEELISLMQSEENP